MPYKVIYDDIVSYEGSAIVNSLGKSGSLYGEVCFNILHAAQSRELTHYINSLKNSKIGQIYITEAGKLPVDKILHLVTPFKKDDDNINSNLKLASGYRFRYNELRDAGANVCLGTDGCASSNNLDMLETMKTSAMIQKAWRNDPSAMPVNEVISMATSNAAKALGINAGKIEEGALADLVIVDVDNYSFMSPGSFEANLIYSAHSECISSVICNGRILMKDRVVPGEKEILAQARKCIDRIK